MSKSEEDKIGEQRAKQNAAVLDGPGVFEAANMIVPCSDLISRISIYNEKSVEILLDWLSRQADHTMKKGDKAEGRALYGVAIALREYADACKG